MADASRQEQPSTDDIALDTPVTTVIRQQPKADAVARYEDWLKRVIPVAQGFTGHQGVNVIRPHGGADAYTIVLHFDTIGNLRKWMDSASRIRLVEEIKPYLREPEAVDIKTGFEFWFTPPPAGKPAKPWKQFLVTLSAIFPLTILVPWLLQPLLGAWSVLALPGIRHFLVAVVIVALMVYAIMPRYTRLVSRWLFR